MLRSTTFLAAFALTGCVPHLVTRNAVDPSDWVAPENRWGTNEILPPASTQCGGFDVGDTLCDIRLPDQYGDEVSVWQFWGDVILLDVSTIWCSPCQALAEHTQDTIDEFADRGFTEVTVILEDVEGHEPNVEDAKLWADTFGIEAPVLADIGDVTRDSQRNGLLPVLLLIDREMVIRKRIEPPQHDVVHDAIEKFLANEK